MRIVGLYILHKITSSNLGISKQECGLYRDDGLIITRKSKRELDILRKKLHKLFTPLGLNITVNSGTKQVDFLDVTLDLTTGTFQPYRKETAPPVYVHRKSNHPPSITKNIPEMIEKRINSRCSNEQAFNKHKGTYEAALRKSGYTRDLKYNATPAQKKPRKKPRYPNQFWFNPPWNQKVKTNIAKEFL